MDCKKGIFRVVYEAMMFCYKKLHLWKVPVPGRDRVKTDLQRIHPGENQQECITEYYVTKLTLSVLILLIGIALAVGVHYSTGKNGRVQEEWIYRGTEEEGTQKYDITGQIENGGSYSFLIEVPPRKYTEEELQTLYRQFAEELPFLILGENEAPDRIKKDLKLLEYYEGYPFQVEWKSDSSEIIETNGEVHPQKEDTVVCLESSISCEEFQTEEEIQVTVIKREETTAESEKRRLSELLQQAQEEDPENEKIWLPEKMDGKKIAWKENGPRTGWKLFAGAGLTAIAVFFFKDRDLHDQVEKKKNEERRTYPEILQKMILYLEAGLTVRTAFCHIADDYERDRERGEKKQEAYEQILMAAREIHLGVPEGIAYENFGKRTGVREYIRLSTSLIQNLKKGSSMLLQQLKEETRSAEEIRMQNARKLSEEASTKLLLPMIMLLLIVMIMIMVPAFSNVGV